MIAKAAQEHPSTLILFRFTSVKFRNKRGQQQLLVTDGHTWDQIFRNPPFL